MEDKGIQNLDESLDQNCWKKIFIGACLCAVIVDPLFLYVPILNDDIKCLMLDPKLKIVVLLLRSITDFFFLIDIIIRIYRSENFLDLIDELKRRQHRINFNFVLKRCVPRIAKTVWASNDLLIDIVALLPLTQMAILIFFSKMSDLRSLTTTRMVLMNVFVLLQYMPRVIRIYRSSMELKRTLEEEIAETPVWIKGVLNFCMYIIASHVVGALWYFFAIQRMMICWHFACRKHVGCDNRIFSCHDHHLFRNTTILNDLCPVSVSGNSSDTILFDFGIFVTVLQYGVVGSTNYFQKFLNCFWWGLRNLSSLGSNLEPSVDGWENLYTVFISITGLLLFLYLIGNLQMYMQLESTRTENRMQMKRKMKGKDKEIELWLSKNGIPTRSNKDIKLQIMEKLKQAVQEDTDTNLDNILPLLPSDVQSRIKDSTPLPKLKQVPMLRGIDDDVFNIICQKLEPVRYTGNSFIIQKGEPLDKMVYILDGFVSIEERSSDDSRRGAGELFGEELLRWPLSVKFPLLDMLATESVKAIGVVEALALKARDLESIYIQSGIREKEEPRHRRMIKEELERNIDELIRRNGIPEKLDQDVKWRIMKELFQEYRNVYWNILDWGYLVSRLSLGFRNKIESYMLLAKLKEVPMLRGMDEGLLKIIHDLLKPVSYTENSLIFRKGEPLYKMVYIVDGFVSIEERSSDDSRRGVGELCGQELLRWPFYFDFPHTTTPLATKSVKAISVVEALALNARDLQNIYIQSDIKEKEEPRHRRMIKEELERNIDELIRRNGIPEKLNQDIKWRIMKNLFQEYMNVYWNILDWDYLVSHLPLDFQNEIKSYMPLTKLKEMYMQLESTRTENRMQMKRKMKGKDKDIKSHANESEDESYMLLTKLKEMSAFRYDESVWKEICCHLRPMKYNRTDNIIEKGDPIQTLLIVEGRIRHKKRAKGAGEIYGEELLLWPFSTSFPDRVPTAAESLLVITDVVEVLVLTASDMKSVATEFRKHFIKNYDRLVSELYGDFPVITEETIKEATRNYTCLNYPNEGGYGTVYHTELYGRAVAIKTCNSATGDPFIQSQRLVQEAFVLSLIRHPNVVELFGCCSETRWPIMVYIRTNALTLVERFHINKSKLSLESRMKIAAETAEALEHVHSKSIIHGDVKAANILIDNTTDTVTFTGFGASRLLDEDEVSPLPGTSRCLDPEYLKSHDVYGFGVVLVELLTRREAVSSDGSETSLANDFLCSVQEDRLGQILDGEINADEFSFATAKKVSKLAVTCLRSRWKERPSMLEVTVELYGLFINGVEPSTVDDNISSASRTSK